MIKIKEIKTVISKCTGIKLIELNDDSCAADFPKWDSLAHLKIMLALFFKQRDVVSVLNDVILILSFLNFKSLKSEFFIIDTLSSEENR